MSTAPPILPPISAQASAAELSKRSAARRPVRGV